MSVRGVRRSVGGIRVGGPARLGALVGLLLVGAPSALAAQGVQLTGTYVRYVAIGPDGAMICSAADCGAERSMAYREALTDPGSCDLYAPGSAQESFTVEANGVRMTNSGAGPDAITRLGGPTIVGRTIVWSGRAARGAIDLRVDQVVELRLDDRSVRMSVTLTNQGSAALSEVYYLRNGDPDLGQCNIGTSFETRNDVVRQPPVHEGALATIGGGDRSTPERGIVLGLGAHDPRARAHTAGFANTEASTEWASPYDAGGRSADVAVDLVFREPSLGPGASTTFELLYVWGPDEATVEARFDELGFPTAPCVGVAEGAACATRDGAGGVCRAGRCCTGCWDGGRCRAGSSVAACGAGGAACAGCADADPCTSDVCASGVCQNPLAPAGTRCDDGLFCTAFDTCDGRGGCSGAGERCADRQTCTTDACDEAADRCDHVGLPDGTACTRLGASGQCHAAGCCTGCFDGRTCRVGTGVGACGAGGGACAVCRDGDPCTSDVCARGVCENPSAPRGTACDDGLFCTASDVCDGAGACEGSGDRCDDRQACTTERCDEAADRCESTVTRGCVIGGECVEDGAANPTYPCQLCDPSRDEREWSPQAAGEACGRPLCSVGRLLTRACDATGGCVARAPTPCPSGVCAADGAACGEGCTSGSCERDSFCDGATRMCTPLRILGAACREARECALGRCVDGLCCDSACDGVCLRCDGAGSTGTCAPVSAGRDPDGECPRGCDGAGACALTADGGARDAGLGPDAGPADAAPPVHDAAVADAAPIDAGVAPVEGGCACRAAPARGRHHPGGLLGALALLLGGRRRPWSSR